MSGRLKNRHFCLHLFNSKRVVTLIFVAFPGVLTTPEAAPGPQQISARFPVVFRADFPRGKKFYDNFI
jgi:hypothetical protein